MLNDAICTSLISRPYTPNPCLPPCPAPAPPLPPAEGGVLALADLLRRDAPEILAEAVPALRTLSFSALPGVLLLLATAHTAAGRSLRDGNIFSL